MTRRLRLGLAACAVLLLALATWLGGTAEDAERPAPFATLARDVEWIRFQRALLRGEEERALRHAERAVRLDRRHTESWQMLATHLAVFRGSPEREPDLARRRAWFRAGVDVARSGERAAREPARLALWRGVLLLDRDRIDPDVEPGGRRALLEAALEALEAARALGADDAAPLADYAREELAERAPD